MLVGFDSRDGINNLQRSNLEARLTRHRDFSLTQVVGDVSSLEPNSASHALRRVDALRRRNELADHSAKVTLSREK